MSFTGVISGVITRWSDQDMDDTVTGGLHLDEVPKGTSMPYAVITDLGESVHGRASGGEEGYGSHYMSRQFQLRLHANTGPVALAVMADTINSILEYAPLNLGGVAAGSDAELLYCRLNSNIITKDDAHENAWMWAGTYDALYSVSRELSPT